MSEARGGTPSGDGRDDGRGLFLGDEGEALAASSRRGRAADRELATALHRPLPSSIAASAGYLGALGRRPELPQSLERELVAAAQAGDRRARARLVEACMPLIASVARLYRESPGIDRIELLQEGVVGLLRALERFDPGRGVPFWAYAGFWVRQAMQQLIAELTRPMVLSDRALRQLARIRDAHRQAVVETGREPDLREVARRAGLTPEQVDNLLAADRTPRSTEEPLASHEGAVGLLGELLVDPLAEGEYESVVEAIETQELVTLLAGLSDRERAVLRARFGVDTGEEQSLRAVAGRLGVSAERVRQIERRALGKLAAAAGHGVDPAGALRDR